MKTIGLWLARKALYTAVGAAGTAAVAYIGVVGTNYDLHQLTMAGALGGIGAAVIGDLRRKLFPDLLQVVTGQDPREDG